MFFAPESMNNIVNRLFRNGPGGGIINLLRILCLWFWTSLWLFALTISTCLLLGWTTGDRLLLVRLTRYLAPWVLFSLLAGLIPALLFRRFWLAMAMAVPALAIGFSYLPLFLPNHAPPPGAQALLKVMSFNVWSENQSMLPAAEMIRETAPDILLLQEITPNQLKELTLGLETLPDAPHNKWNIVYAPEMMQAVISRYAITPQMTDRKRAKVQKVRVATPDEAVTVFNVHPRRGNWEVRHRQLATLLREYVLTASGPVILGGDFNTTDQSQTYKMLSKHLHNAHWQAGHGFGLSYPAYLYAWNEYLPAWPLVRIDHIFYNEKFFAVSAETLQESCGSDHLPVMTALMLVKKPQR
jgi:endonuclease/exonuclease/phosphatase (EEP) superfamily protein YafD